MSLIPPIPTIKCQGKQMLAGGCENDARYINSAGEWLCSLCDMKRAWRSIRISSIPQLLTYIAGLSSHEQDLWVTKIKELTWRKTKI